MQTPLLHPPPWCRCPKICGAGDFPFKELTWAPAEHMLAEWHGIGILLPSLIHKETLTKGSTIIEWTLALKSMPNWSNKWQFICKFFPVSYIIGPSCASFLKYILIFTKNDHRFSWNTGTLEIYHIKSTQLLASSFSQKTLLTFDISVFFLLFNSQTQKYADLLHIFCP